MIWIGLIGGIVIGAALGGFEGAVVAGFIGWLGGVIVKSTRNKAAPVPVVAPVAVTAQLPLEQRVRQLELDVQMLKARLGDVAPAEVDTVIPLEADIVIPVETGIQSEADAALVEPASPPPPLPPAKPNPIVAWLLGGNTIARVGLLILFIGLSFLLKYAADHSMLPVELRVAAVALGGIALLVVGWRLRESRRGYALGLQGAGVAVLYLTVFGAFRLWGLIPGGVAFGMLAAIAVFSAILAVKQDAMVLAAFGAGGGFLAPVLASTGGGNHAVLFSYYLLLNLGIAAIAFFKAWRPLNLIGFLFTFLIGTAWGVRSYRPELFASTEPFLVAFFLLYIGIAILYARRQAPELKHYVDGTLVFGVPLAAIGLQAGMLKGTEFAEFGLAFSSLGMAAIYMTLAVMLRRAPRENYSLLTETFIALGVVFATAAIPLALDARWTSASWAVEGAAIVWLGIRQRRVLARAFGLLLQPLAASAYFNALDRPLEVAPPLLDSRFIGALLLAAAGIWIYRVLRNAADNVTKAEQGVATFAFFWGLAWWLFGATHEIALHLQQERWWCPALVLMVSGTALACNWLGVKRGWKEAEWATFGFLPLTMLLAAISLLVMKHPFDGLGVLAWPVAIAVHVIILRAVNLEGSSRLHGFLHGGGAVLLAALGAIELHWLAEEFTARHTAWSVAAAALVPALLMSVIASRAFDEKWPVAEAQSAYRGKANGVLAIYLVLWTLYANISHDGRSDPLPFVPLLNALDLMQVFVFAAMATAWRALQRMELDAPQPKTVAVIGGALVFLWLNGVLLRTLHHWAGVPYDIDGILRSTLAQASLSMFWSVLALALMIYATRTARRVLWVIGAALMGVVVVKLFLLDLSQVTGIMRIVSFIGIGVLMLVIGYFSPVPPRKQEAP